MNNVGLPNLCIAISTEIHLHKIPTIQSFNDSKFQGNAKSTRTTIYAQESKTTNVKYEAVYNSFREQTT